MHRLFRFVMLLGIVSLVAMRGHPTASNAALVSPVALAQAAATRSVILAVQRDHQLHIFDAATLQPLGTVAINGLAASVQSRPDGQMLFVRQSETPDGSRGCCALFALDLTTSEICRLIAPSIQPVPVPTSRVFNQRGNAGIEVFDAQTLEQVPTIAAPGVYSLFPSPDGRWLFGISRFPTAALDLFDVTAGLPVEDWPLAFPGADSDGDSNNAPWFTGAWLNGQFYLYASDGTTAYLWTVAPDATQLAPPAQVTIDVPDLAADALPILPSTLVAGDDQLFLYEPRAWWLLPPGRIGMPGGGVFALDPTTATLTAEFAPEVDLAQVVPSSDGRALVGLAAGDPSGGRTPSILALDAETGALLNTRTLSADIWSIATATLPETLLPLGDMQPAPCSRPEPALSPLPPVRPATVPSK